jgi:anti-sigma factor RsiW
VRDFGCETVRESFRPSGRVLRSGCFTRVADDTNLASDDLTCEQFLDTLGAFVAGELAPAARARCEYHVAACGDCASYRKDYEATMRLTREAAGGDAALPDALVERILAARRRSS